MEWKLIELETLVPATWWQYYIANQPLLIHVQVQWIQMLRQNKRVFRFAQIDNYRYYSS